MSNVLNRQMFVKGYRGGSSVRGEPRGARPESVYDSGLFKPILGFDFLSGIAKGIETSKREKETGTSAYFTKGIVDNLKETFRATPDYYGDMFNYILAPVEDLNRGLVQELGTAVFGLDRGSINTGEGSGFRAKTERNPYGFPDQLNQNPMTYFSENFPVGSKKRLNFLIDAVRQPNFAFDLAKIGVGASEIRQAEKALVEGFRQGRERGLKDDQAAGVYDFPQDEELVQQAEAIGGPIAPFKDVKTGDLSLMEDLAKEGPFPQPQTDLTRGGESPIKIDKRAKDLINLLGGGEEKPNDDIVNEKKDEVINESSGGEEGFANKDAAQNDLANREAGTFDFERETERFKGLLRDATETKDSTTPALLLLQLASNLVSGKTNEKGVAGFLDVLGQASGPVLDGAIKLAQERKAYDRELGASAVSMAFQKEQDMLDRAASIAADSAKLNQPFDKAMFLRGVEYAPDGSFLRFTSAVTQVNSPLEAEQLNPITDITTSDGTVIRNRNFVLVDSREDATYYKGLRDPTSFFKEGNERMNQLLGSINFVTAIAGEDLVNERGEAIVGPKALLSLFLGKTADIAGALTNNVDTAQLYNAKEAQDIELAFSEIENFDTGLTGDADKELKARMRQNLILKTQGIDYNQQFVDLLNEEIYQNKAFGDFTINDILQNPDAVDEFMKAKGYNENSTIPVANEMGETTLMAIGDVKQDAQDTFNFLVDTAAEEGIQFIDGKFIRPEATSKERYNFSFAGKQLSIDPKVFQLGLKGKILGIQFARFQQPQQRLLKDTIESSIGEFKMDSVTQGPIELSNKLGGFKESMIKRYDTLVQQNFQTEEPGIYDLYKWQPNKVSVFQMPTSSTQGNYVKPTEQVPIEKLNQNALQSTGQNNTQKSDYFNLKGILEEYGMTL